MLIGRIGQKYDLKVSQNQNPMLSFSLACNEKKGEEPDWFNITCFKGTAEFVNTYLEKGNQVYVEGSIKITRKDEKTYVNIFASKILALGGKTSRESKDESFESSTPPISLDDDRVPF